MGGVKERSSQYKMDMDSATAELAALRTCGGHASDLSATPLRSITSPVEFVTIDDENNSR